MYLGSYFPGHSSASGLFPSTSLEDFGENIIPCGILVLTEEILVSKLSTNKQFNKL